jgi:serine/threonine protein kinase/Tol biopolymer transport system component
MTLPGGTRLGPYEVVAAIGAGGMGEVYRARDTRLKRDVALKILPESFATDPDRLARFQREAEVLASLNHPHIAAIYGIEESNDTRALVIELVPGETLADRIARGPIPLDDALPIAKQIAEALEGAHEQGIIHRDLKPANIKLRPDGTVKVLDFGLAKLAETVAAVHSSGRSLSPTITSPAMMTGVGVLLGTAAYMSPEQARGKATDKRADIWAFGCVLYEMLSGRRAFEAEEVSDTLAFVLTKEPRWDSLPAGTPPLIRRLLVRCLEKDRKRRLADIADAKFDIEDTTVKTDAPLVNEAYSPRAIVRRLSRAGLYLWIAAIGVLVAVFAATFVLSTARRSMTVPEPLRLSVELGADVSLVNRGSVIALSPDGTLLAFVAPSATSGTAQLYVRALQQLQATALPGTAGARDPFFSPDGQWIAFFADGRLKKISVRGGASVTLCDARNARGGAWAEDGSIIFQPEGNATPLFRVSSAGGSPQPVTKLDSGELVQRWPQVLPGGRALLYTSHNAAGDFDGANIVVHPLPTGGRRIIQRGGYFGRYVSSGHLLYIHEGTLFAAPFDPERLEITGQAVPVLEGVASAPTGTGLNGAAQFAISNSGTLVYLPGESFAGDPIDWVDRSGKTTPLRTTRANWANPQFAPDGQRLAISILEGPQRDIWIYDWGRDTLTRLTFESEENNGPIWTPDGRRIAFGSRRLPNLISNLYWRRADGTGDVQRLTESSAPQFPGSWHPSGKFLAFSENSPQTNSDVMILPMEGDETSGWKPGKPSVFLNTPFAEQNPTFSPDGRWLAYNSDESGRAEVYVRPFPGRGAKLQVSTGGGADPKWSGERRELLYRSLDSQIMVASYQVTGDSFTADRPRPWSEQRFVIGRRFAVHPDGERVAVAVLRESGATKQDKVVFIFNFFDELKRLAPVK